MPRGTDRLSAFEEQKPSRRDRGALNGEKGAVPCNWAPTTYEELVLPLPLKTTRARERLGQLKELRTRKGRDFSRLSISMVSVPEELKRKPELLVQLHELGVGQLILTFTGATAQDTIAQLEDCARVVKN